MKNKGFMTIRLNKVTRDLNVGITTVVEFLQKKGYAVESSPNAKITEEQYAELVKEFSKDKNLKKEMEKFTQERQTKERGKATVAIEGFEDAKKEDEEIDLRPVSKFKPVGKIDLDALNKKPEASAKPEPQEVQVIVEEKQAESEQESMNKENPGTNHTQEMDKDEVFKIRQTEFKSSINVLGKIDLDALNQSTRPKKKTKEEKRKERDEKERQRQQQRQQLQLRFPLPEKERLHRAEPSCSSSLRE